MSGYARHTICASVIPFIPSLNDQNQLSILNCFDMVIKHIEMSKREFGFRGYKFNVIYVKRNAFIDDLKHV